MYFHANTSLKVRTAAGLGAAMAVDDPHRQAIMFGGQVPGLGLTNTTFRVNQTTAVWNLLNETVAPSPRTDFSFASAPGCGMAVLFGGVVNITTQAVTNDTWLFNFTTLRWINITPAVGPAPRQGAALAVDDRRCEAVLFGGVDLTYHSGNSTGNVRWNDTWSLDLSTRRWSPVAAINTPPSLSDSGFLYDNTSRLFLLYGGCESLCTGQIWRFSLSNNAWNSVAGTSYAPVGRGGAVWSYSATYDVAILSTGYALNGNTRTALNDTYAYEIGANRWDFVGGVTPTPRFLGAGGWLGANGCPGLVLVGGGGAPTNPPDQWFLDPAPDIPAACDTWGNDSITTGGNGGGGAGCDREFHLTVLVVSSNTGLGIPGANVTAAGNCSRSSGFTDPNGSIPFLIAFQPYTVTVVDGGYHDNQTTYTPIPPSLKDNLTIQLVPRPDLILHTYARDSEGTLTPLGNVSVTTDGGIPLGVTNDTGVFLKPAFEPLGIAETFYANKTNYSGAVVTSIIPYTGPWYVNLTLLLPGPIDVQVVEAGVRTPLPGAAVTVSAVPVGALGGFQGIGNPEGWVNGTAIAGNYSVTATLAGYIQLQFIAPFFHAWATVTVITINMTSDAGYVVDVRLMDGSTGQPIAEGHVQVGVYPTQATGPSGWANQSAVKPAGTYEVVGWATNYTSNRTTVVVSYHQPIWIIVLNLTPAGACLGPGPGCTKTPEKSTVIEPLSLWPGGPPSASLLFGGGLLLLIVPTAFLWLSRRRPSAAPGSEKR
jgi:hypothetical protein